MLKKYMFFIMVLIAISIALGMSYSNFKVTSENHKVAEMYIGTLKYSMTIDGTNTNTLSVPNGETIVDVIITNENPIDTYYKLIYENNSNITITYYEGYELDDSNNISNSYDSPNDKLLNVETKTLKLKIINNSTSSQTITFKITGGFATNTLDDVTVPTGYTIIEKDTSTNTYFCTTTDTLTQGLKYANGQYTYAYKQEGKVSNLSLNWSDINNNGWGVQLTDKTSTDAVTSKTCTYINNKPITSMTNMFSNSNAAALDISNFNTNKVTNMSWMFSPSQATTLDLGRFDTSNVTNMKGMFNYSEATTLDLSNFDTSNVTDMNSMFSFSKAVTLDVSNFNTSKVTNMDAMFYYSKATILDVSNFDTSKVTSMGNMFADSQATSLDLSAFDTSNVTNMYGMFSWSKLSIIDLSAFDTSNVTNMGYMFSNVGNLKTIYVSDKFNTNNVTSGNSMFTGSTKLIGGSGTTYNSSYVDKTYARIDGGTSNPGYFTDVADKDIPEPNSFATDSWKTIAKAARTNNTGKYNVGDTRTIDMGDYGTHTLRIANTTTPSECSKTGFSQSACGFVFEFVDIITTHNMNDAATNVGGWPASSMYAFVNNDIYNALPSELRNVIIDTTTVTGHGSTSGETNFISTDKLYLLSTAEIWLEGSSNQIGEYDTARDVTRQLDYYKNSNTDTVNKNSTIKMYNGTSADWWTRSARSDIIYNFIYVSVNGGWGVSGSNRLYGVSPAFRIG